MRQNTQTHTFQTGIFSQDSSIQDKLWITQTLAGDSQAYAKLVNKYSAQFLELTRRILKDQHAQADDIVQEAFIQAYRHLNLFRNEAKFSTWFYSIVMNGLRNGLRRHKIIRWSSLDAPIPNSDELYAPEVQHSEPLLDSVVEQKMDIESVKQIVETFSPSYRSIVTLYYFQHLTLPEIAKRLQMPLGTVKVYIYRARKLLCDRFNKPRAPLSQLASSPLAKGN